MSPKIMLNMTVVLAVLAGGGALFSCSSRKPTEPTFAISATSGAHGTIAPSGSITIKQGASQTFSFAADSGYNLVSLRVDGAPVTAAPSYTFTNITANHYIYASFSHTFHITASASAHGSISPSGSVEVFEGESKVFTITPDFGYRVAGVLVDGVTVGPVSVYTFSNVTGDHTISATFSLTPGVLTADNGLYYKGTMGSASVSPSLVITASDSLGASANQWVSFSILSGDGTIGADSLQSDALGKVQPAYNFNGALGHAKIRAIWPGRDTLDLFLRANTLVFGDSAQGQYVRMRDNFGFVKSFNGNPERVDVDPSYWLTYAVYETSLGLVVILEDVDQNDAASDFEPVLGIIVNGGYSGKFGNGIGIGSTVGAVDTAFGPPDTTYFDPTPPAAWTYVYRSEGLIFYADQATPRRVFEIHLITPSSSSAVMFRRLVALEHAR